MAVKTVQAIINGQTYTLNYNSETQRYEATITAPAKSSFNEDGHYYPVTVKASDDAGNETSVDDTHETLGSSLQLKVKEKVAPVSVITAPTSGQLTSNSKPEITWTVTDDDSGVAADTITLLIDNTPVEGAITKSPIENGYSCSYTPGTALDDGQHTVIVRASDNDGNAASDVSVTFRVLATAPNLSVTTPVNNSYHKTAEVAFSGTTDGATLTVKVGDGAEEDVTIAEGAFSGSLTLTAEGSNTVVFKAVSESGVETTVTRTLYLDTHAPVIQSVTITPNPVDAGATYIISVEVTD